tara:strand:- start:704 stop:889 length:186 start_codon:yes stop_codon:yes gene_type:complete
MEKTHIKGVGNYYGGVWVQEIDGKFYWIIENYDTDFEEIEEWTLISQELYEALISENGKII